MFNVSKDGKIYGRYVTKGTIKRGAWVRLLSEDIVIHEGKLKTLKRFKEDVKEVREGYECGIAFENYEDIKLGDTVEVFETVEEKKYLLWYYNQFNKYLLSLNLAIAKNIKLWFWI